MTLTDSKLSTHTSAGTLPARKAYRIKGLDGLRGASILMVLLSHSSKYLPHPLTNNVLYRIISNGELGVMFFFILSGYLITRLLLNEQDSTGDISIKKFYIRRALRIFPVFFLYLLTLVVLKNTVFPQVFSDYLSILFSAFYIWNYKHLLTDISYNEVNGYWFMGHLWTLSMEEQFYLLWPVLFKKKAIEVLKKIVLCIIILMPALRVATFFFFPDSRGQIGMMLHTGGDTILVGCMAALLEKSDKFMTILKMLLKNVWLVAAAFLYVFIIHTYLFEQFGGAYSLLFGASLVNISIMFLVFWCLYMPSVVQRVLDTNWLKYVGMLSYSLYIWQQLFLTTRYHAFFSDFPVNLIVVFIVAWISYHFIEKPILKFKSQFKS